jgi:hypothetical protein
MLSDLSVSLLGCVLNDKAERICVCLFGGE